jgi:unsaturated chondroitin disaccharide hydrolase
MRLFTALASLALLATLARAQDPAVLQLVRDDFDHVSAQYSGMLDQLKNATGNPRTYSGHMLTVVGTTDWTSGFFPGALWYLYEYTGDTKWRDAAVRATGLVESAKNITNTHDVGFILNCSFGQGYRLTADPTYRDVLLKGASSLSTRFNPVVGCIKSWDNRPQWKYPVIIDNMMNLELLVRATNLGGSTDFASMAISHANKTRDNHFRSNASSYHVVSYFPDTGAVEIKQTWQGAFDESSWARGQSWALYGFTMMYRETRHSDYLDLTKRIASFLMAHPRMPADKVPYWDFDAPNIPNTPRDASAAAIMSSALIELSSYVDPALGNQYLAFAEDQIRSLSSPNYRATPGTNGNFLLMHSTGSYPGNSEVDVPLIYADYYYLEALMRYKAHFGLTSALSPTFTTSPTSQTVTDGSSVVFTARASGSPAPTYSWSLNGHSIAGATSPQLVLTASTSQSGRITCTATNTGGSITSDPATLSVSMSSDSGRLTNLSTRAWAGTGAQTLIVGFTVGGGTSGGSQPLLVRGMGNSLTGFGVTGVLSDPTLTIFRSGTSVAMMANDNWNGDPLIASRCTQVGAFPFSANDSAEAALARSFDPGAYTAHVVGTGSATGIALAEIYDTTSTQDNGPSAPRLTNISTRAFAGTDAQAVFIGFVISGTTSRSVLIRGIGPGLASFGVTGTLTNPTLQLFRGSTLIAENDDWGGDAQLTTIGTKVGAFALSDPTSKDAMILTTLPPGLYSVQLTGVNNTTGVAMAEFYEVP